MNGYLLIDKPKDWTSRDVCNKIQHLFHEKKVGHAGTLDPFATGLLIVCLGTATKTITLWEDADKEYLAELTLGSKTDTGDQTGKIIATSPVSQISISQIKEALASLLGESEQVPPMTSAVHVDGKKLYKYFYQGQEIERKARKINTKSCDLLSFSDNIIIFKCRVSKGTYLRTLGETIAEKLGTVGFLSNLRRLKISEANVNDSTIIENVSEQSIIPLEQMLEKLIPYILLDEADAIKAKNGMKISFGKLPKDYDKVLLLDQRKKAIAIYARQNENAFACLRGLWE
ncbi:MAG TPA: tRNA pseudouridine(55) synthase TruB [Bacilli bacterium]|nr:tRNA pseudouridine(55) synthase TruB [Bacilli bacterium]HPS18775.1 tRNA pseudouridine(55) synthase TruB [Bacilli bacterium]